MVKTTINLRDDIYKKLMKETVERTVTQKNFSKLINEKLEKAKSETLLSEMNSDETKEY